MSTRLGNVLAYLRVLHQYCFYCGTRFRDEEDLRKRCPGPTEADHEDAQVPQDDEL